jgi:hypothetical protein
MCLVFTFLVWNLNPYPKRILPSTFNSVTITAGKAPVGEKMLIEYRWKLYNSSLATSFSIPLGWAESFSSELFQLLALFLSAGTPLLRSVSLEQGTH